MRLPGRFMLQAEDGSVSPVDPHDFIAEVTRPLIKALEDESIVPSKNQDLTKWTDDQLMAFFFYLYLAENILKTDEFGKIPENQMRILMKLVEWRNCVDTISQGNLLEVEKQLLAEIDPKRDAVFVLKLMSALEKVAAPLFSKLKHLLFSKADDKPILWEAAIAESAPGRRQAAENFVKAFPGFIKEQGAVFAYERLWVDADSGFISAVLGELLLQLLALNLENEQIAAYVRAFCWAAAQGCLMKSFEKAFETQTDLELTKADEEDVHAVYKGLIIAAKTNLVGFCDQIDENVLPTEEEISVLGASSAEIHERAKILFGLSKLAGPEKAFIPERKVLENIGEAIEKNASVNNTAFIPVLAMLLHGEANLNENQWVRCYDTLRKCLFAECMKELPRSSCYRLNQIARLRGSKMGGKLFDEYLEEISSRESIVADLTHADRVPVPDKLRISWGFVFSRANLAKHPNLLSGLLEELVTPDAEGLYKACMLVAGFEEEGREDVIEPLLAKLFPDAESLMNPERSLVVCYILENLPMAKRGRFFKKVLGDKYLPVSDDNNDAVTVRMEQYNAYLGDTTVVPPEKNGSGMGFEDMNWEGLLKPRDIPMLIAEILPNISISLLDQGHRLKNTGVDSELEGFCDETRIAPCRETRKYPKSLACNVTLRDEKGKSFYFKINRDNRLMMRIIRPGAQEQEVDYEANLKARDDGLAEQMYQEIFYFILKKLGYIYLRKKPSDRPVEETVAAAAPEEPAEAAKVDETPAAEPTEAETTTPPASQPDPDPVTSARVEGDHILIITGCDEVGGETMAAADLEDQKVKDKCDAQAANVKIRANQTLAKTLLELYFSAGGLPEKMPAELDNLLVYRMVPIDGEEFYEAVNTEVFYLKLRKGAVKMEDYYIRLARVHSQTLPYVDYKPSGHVIRRLDKPGISEEERVIINERVSRVRQKMPEMDKNDMKRQLFLESGEGQVLDLARRRKILSMEVPNATEANVKQFEVLRGKTREQIERAVDVRINKAVDKNIEAARLKYPAVEGQPNEKFLRIQDRTHRLAKVLKEMEVKLEMELLGKFVRMEKRVEPEDIGGETRRRITLRFPQVFPFEQTFNRGQFESLEKLLGKMAGGG